MATNNKGQLYECWIVIEQSLLLAYSCSKVIPCSSTHVPQDSSPMSMGPGLNGVLMSKDVLLSESSSVLYLVQ